MVVLASPIPSSGPRPVSATVWTPASLQSRTRNFGRGSVAPPARESTRQSLFGPGGVLNATVRLGETDAAPKIEKPVEVQPGKAPLSREEAVSLLATLDASLVEVDEEALDKEPDECVRALSAGPYPLAVRVRDALSAALAAAPAGQPWAFSLSMGELNAVEKTVECQEALGRVKVTRTVVTVGGFGAVALLFFLI